MMKAQVSHERYLDWEKLVVHGTSNWSLSYLDPWHWHWDKYDCCWNRRCYGRDPWLWADGEKGIVLGKEKQQGLNEIERLEDWEYMGAEDSLYTSYHTDIKPKDDHPGDFDFFHWPIAGIPTPSQSESRRKLGADRLRRAEPLFTLQI